MTRGRKSIYPWDEWLAGGEFVAEYERDFHCMPIHFSQALRNKASKTEGVRVEIVFDTPTTVRFEFIKTENEETEPATS